MANNSRSMSAWTPVALICLGLLLLGIIGSVIVLSLISVYLQPKNNQSTEDKNKDKINTINMVFATNLKDGYKYSIADVDFLTRQLNQQLNSPLFKINVQSASFVFSTASITNNNNQRKKRQTFGTISCDTEVVGSNQSSNNGNKMMIKSQLNKAETPLCPYGYCYQTQMTIIERKIQSKFQSMPFSLDVKLSDGTTLSITVLFCAFGSVTTCNDGIKNEDETDVDCGGSCTQYNRTCLVGATCKVTSDCSSGVCKDNICQNQSSLNCSNGLLYASTLTTANLSTTLSRFVSIVGDFYNDSWYNYPVKSTIGPDNQIGSTRIITDPEGVLVFYETLKTYILNGTYFEQSWQGPGSQINSVDFGDFILGSYIERLSGQTICDGNAVLVNFGIDFCATNLSTAISVLDAGHVAGIAQVQTQLNISNFTSCNAINTG